MSAVYVDTSALGRVLLEEPDEPLIRRALQTFDNHVSSRLLQVELRRLALRERVSGADQTLNTVTLAPLDEAILGAAETIEPAGVATLDAIHLATALHIDADELVAYERRLLDAAETRALRVASPGLQWRAAEPGR